MNVKNSVRPLAKFLFWIAFTIVVGFATILIAGLLLYPSEYVLRAARWGDADVYDYQKFPERTIETSTATFHFDEFIQADLVAELFEQSSQVDDLEGFLTETDTQAFIVIQDGAILYEQYFNGATAESIITSFSVAKSVTSALVGIAITDGFINSVDDPITSYLPELAERDPSFGNIMIRDLLLMSSGLSFVEVPFFGDDTKTYYYPDLRQLALEHTEVESAPGGTFFYNKYHPLLLGMVLERATGITVSDYLEEKLWQPMGMTYPASWSLDSEATGFEKMESGINGRAIDFAKFAQLYLNDGRWQGQQLIPAQWVADSTQMDNSVDYASYYPDSYTFAGGRGYYGYMWWGLLRDEGLYDYAAVGNHGQFLYVSPHKELIIVRFGERYGIESLDWLNLFYDVASHIPATDVTQVNRLRAPETYLSGVSQLPPNHYLFTELKTETIPQACDNYPVEEAPPSAYQWQEGEPSQPILRFSTLLTSAGEFSQWTQEARWLVTDLQPPALGFLGYGRVQERLETIESLPYTSPHNQLTIHSIATDGTVVAEAWGQTYFVEPGQKWSHRAERIYDEDCTVMDKFQFINRRLLTAEQIYFLAE